MAPSLAPDGLSALRALHNSPPDIVLLDLMLPGVDGWHLIRQTREWAPRLPIIVVTARTNEHDRVEVLSLGADDVVAKPFSMRELMARVQAALRRIAVAGDDGTPEAVHEGEMSIDPERMTVTIAGRMIDLTPLEFTLLWTLADGRTRALSRDEIFRLVWGRERGHGDRSVDVWCAACAARSTRPPAPSPTCRPCTGSATALSRCRAACPAPRRRCSADAEHRRGARVTVGAAFTAPTVTSLGERVGPHLHLCDVPMPVSECMIGSLPLVNHRPRPFQPASASSMRPSSPRW